MPSSTAVGGDRVDQGAASAIRPDDHSTEIDQEILSSRCVAFVSRKTLGSRIGGFLHAQSDDNPILSFSASWCIT